MTTSRKNPAKQSAKAYAVRRPHEEFYILEGWPIDTMLADWP